MRNFFDMIKLRGEKNFVYKKGFFFFYQVMIMKKKVFEVFFRSFVDIVSQWEFFVFYQIRCVISYQFLKKYNKGVW